MKSFTLLETIASTVILIIMAASIVYLAPGFLNFLRKNAASDRIDRIKNGLEAYYHDSGSYPAYLTYLIVSDSSSWQGPYFSGTDYELQYDPWRYPFVWTRSSSGQVGLILSTGANGTNNSCGTPNCSDWIPGIGFQPSGDDIGSEISPRRPEYEKLLSTKKKLVELAKRLEEYFYNECSKYLTQTTNFFPTDLRQIASDGELYDDFGLRIRCNRSLPNWYDCQEDADPSDSDPAYEIGVYSGLGIFQRSVSAVAYGRCYPDQRAGWPIVSAGIPLATNICYNLGAGAPHLCIITPSSESGNGPESVIGWGNTTPGAQPSDQAGFMGQAIVRRPTAVESFTAGGILTRCYATIAFTCCDADLSPTLLNPFSAFMAAAATIDSGVFYKAR